MVGPVVQDPLGRHDRVPRGQDGLGTVGPDHGDAAPTQYGRVMLKISGEALMGDQGYGLHPPTVQRIADDLIADLLGAIG